MKGIRIVAVIALWLLGVTSVMGGLPLILDPSGGILKMPVSLLRHSPFEDFLIPGVILLTANGLLSFAVLALTVQRVRGYAVWIAAQGCVIAGWITVEVILLRAVMWAHYAYWALGLVLLVSGLLLKSDRTDGDGVRKRARGAALPVGGRRG